MTDLIASQDETLKALLRNDFGSFVKKVVQETAPDRKYRHNWHIDAMTWQASRIVKGENNRLIVSIAPRSLKSTIFSVALVAFLLGHDPTMRIIVISYTESLALELAYQTRRLMETDWYQELFPGTRLSADKRAGDMFKTTKNGFRLARSIGGSITGFGGDVIIIDDPLKPEDARSETKRQRANNYYSSTLLSRLDDKDKGAIIIVMQRLHEDDLVGYVLPLDDWHHLKLPATAIRKEAIEIGLESFHVREPGDLLHSERESLETLNAIRKTLGPVAFSAQYQQEPVPPEGAIFKLEQFCRYDELPPRHFFQYILQSWDTAVSAEPNANYSACVIVAVRGEDIYIVGVYREKLDFPDLEKKALKLFDLYKANVAIVEGSHIGKVLCGTLNKKQNRKNFRPAYPKGSKEERAVTETPRIAAGHLHLPNDAPWLEDFEKELLQFPAGRYDDQVDAFTQALYAIGVRGNDIVRGKFP